MSPDIPQIIVFFQLKNIYGVIFYVCNVIKSAVKLRI